MKAAARHEWSEFLEFYFKQNAGRLTRLGVFEGTDGVVTDYWLESGLPLNGLDIDARGGRPTIQIIVGEYTHEIIDASELVFRFRYGGDEDGIDVTGADGRTTILRFEAVENGN